MMRVFLCGGGAGEQVKGAYQKLNEIIDHNKLILYIPLAMEEERYNDCYKWILEELKDVNVMGIEMVRSGDDIVSKNLDDYGAIFIGGGNTFKLLKELKISGAFLKIKEYMECNGIVFGGSAGAIIMGEAIDTVKYDDSNNVGLEDITGFNVLNNISLLCHYTNEPYDKTMKNKKYLLELSKEEKILALPEEDTIYYENGSYIVYGDRPYYIFDSGSMVTMHNKMTRLRELNKVNSPESLMEFMNHNIVYGWLDIYNKKHLNNLKHFRQIFRTSTIDEILETGLATCIGQAKFIKDMLSKLGYETKMFCLRRYETEDILDDVKMHCFVLYKDGYKWYHFEHSNTLKRGIHEYYTLEDAIKGENEGRSSDDIRVLTEIDEIPEHINFKEFNLYVNSLEDKKLKK